MNFIDGILLEIDNMSASEIIESIATKIYSEPIERRELTKYPQFVQDIIFIIDLDTELTMNGMFGFIENSTVEYIDETISALKRISADSDANILQNIKHLINPKQLRKDMCVLETYAITSFKEIHNISDDVIDKIKALAKQMYIYNDFDIWSLLEQYVTQAKVISNDNNR